jgi:hypothetical protein
MGAVLIGYCLYALKSGGIVARSGLVTRAERPYAYWRTLVIALIAGLIFLGGFVEWRE